MSRDEFVRETRDGIDRLAAGLLDLEDEPADEGLTELFRTAHTLKGNCSAAGFDAPATVAHALEDVLDAIRAGRLAADRDAVDAALEAVDVLETMIDEIATADRVRTEPDATVDALRTLLERRAADPATESTAGSGPEGTATIDEDAIPEPGSGEDLSAAEALERASGLDDLESLSPPAEGDASLEGGGSFDDLFADESGGDDGAVADAGPEAGDDESPAAETEGTGGEAGGADFDSLRSDVDVLDAGAMDEALEGVDFGDAAGDDDVSVTELLDVADRVRGDDEPSTGQSTTGESESGERPPTGERDGSSPAETAGQSTADRAERAMNAAGIDDQRLVENIQQLEPTEDASDDEAGSFVFDAEVTDATDGDALESEGDTGTGREFEPERPTDDADRDGQSPAVGPDERTSDPDPEVPSGADLGVEPPTGTPGSTPDLEGFDRDANVREFAEAFGDSFEGTEAGARTVPDAVTTIPPSILGDASPTGADEDPVAAAGETITVEGATADRLLQLAERLTTVSLALERGGGSRGEAAGQPAYTRELREIATDLEETVTAVRLQPLEGALSGLERTARRVARETDTQVELVTSGASIELDREVVAALGDPLIHLVRNAVDHGIESPDERAEAGKSRTGTVAIDARKDGDEAVLEVRDDGRGLDADELRRAAVAEEVLTREAAASMSDEDAHELVFHPGLSTQSDVTDVSGRGVGMDVVADAMAGLDGDIEVESTPGEGTTFRLRVPVSVAATEVLFVEAGGRPYAIPAADIARLEEFDLGRVDGDEYAVTVTGDDGPETERRPLVSLSDWLGVAVEAAPEVVVHTRSRHGGTAIACDDVGDWRRVVVRPYDDLLAATPGIDGATLLGNGDLANVLDVAAIGREGSR